MILAIDMGNTNIVIGGIDDRRTYFLERITTNRFKTDLEYAINVKNILEIYGVSTADIEGAIISSVVPPLNATLISAVEKICGKTPMLVGSGMKTGLNIKMDNPKAVGGKLPGDEFYYVGPSATDAEDGVDARHGDGDARDPAQRYALFQDKGRDERNEHGI